jgi:hypothetical protein
VRALAPGAQTLYVANVLPDPFSALGPFTASADVLGGDIYPIGVSADPWVVRDRAAAVIGMARASGRRSAIVLQSMAHDQYPGFGPTGLFPTREQMWQMRDQALAAGPDLLLWYSMQDVLRSGEPARRWTDLVWAAFTAPAGTAPLVP